MLCKIAPTSSDFHALARYLLKGKGRDTHPDRVQWMFTQNLATDDPLLAARFMEATASRSTRCVKPVYHLMVSWHERERPSSEIMQEVARRTLQMAGLDEHQALVIGHGDTPHRHFHVMLNRVDPETRKAWKTSDDFKRFDRIMRTLSDEYGFEYAPAHSFDPELTDEIPQLPNSKSYRAAKKGFDTGRIKWSKRASREFGEHLSENLDRGTTLDDLQMLASDHGLRFEQKGRGIVLGNSEGYATLSSLNLTLTANGMVRKRRSTPDLFASSSQKRNWWDVDAVDLTRAFMSWGLATKEDLKQVIKDHRTERKSRAAARRPEMILSALNLPMLTKRNTRTALSTPRDAVGRPMKTLSRTPRIKPTKDHLDALIAAQTRRDVIERRRMLTVRARQALSESKAHAKEQKPWDISTVGEDRSRP